MDSMMLRTPLIAAASVMVVTLIVSPVGGSAGVLLIVSGFVLAIYADGWRGLRTNSLSRLFLFIAYIGSGMLTLAGLLRLQGTRGLSTDDVLRIASIVKGFAIGALAAFLIAGLGYVMICVAGTILSYLFAARGEYGDDDAPVGGRAPILQAAFDLALLSAMVSFSAVPFALLVILGLTLFGKSLRSYDTMLVVGIAGGVVLIAAVMPALLH